MGHEADSARNLWNEGSGAVSHAFDDWKLVEQDIRAFLGLTQRWSEQAYQKTWAEAQESFSFRFDPERHDPDGFVDDFHDEVEGLWPHDYDWMLHAMVLRDAVTAFEIYIEKSLVEMLNHWVWAGPNGPCKLKFKKQQSTESPSWKALVEVYAAVGVTIDTPDITYIRQLRHLLTHQRGELRTKEKREQFQLEIDQAEEYRRVFGEVRDVPLKRERIVEMMNTLASKVREIDPAPWAYVFGGDKFPPALTKLSEGRRPFLEFIKSECQ